ncbi:MAG: hypothetical protein Kow0089_17660 [Desulfobulbaceae bacterium]
MRIWDVHPGYLNRQSLLGEHRELHGIVSILVNGKKGYSRHPETRRWVGHGWALRRRHLLIAAEMNLRGYTDRSPVRTRSGHGSWPVVYIDEPADQFAILAEKYREREQGRIPLPKNAIQLWSHHKYSILARDQELYRKIGREVAAMDDPRDMTVLARTLTERMRVTPSSGGVRNALEHMWGHVSSIEPLSGERATAWSAARLLREIQRRALDCGETYLLASTALSELTLWTAVTDA